MPPRAPHPRCEICADAYGTGYVCGPCKADPANVGWVPSRELPAADPDTHNDLAPFDGWGEGAAWSPTPLCRDIVRRLSQGQPKARVARELGCDLSYVRDVAAELGL